MKNLVHINITRKSLLQFLIIPILLASFISFSFPLSVQADGSGNLYPSGATGKRASTEWRTDTFAKLLRRTFFRVYATSGENILMGSSAIGVTSAADIVVYAESKISSSQIDATTLAGITPDFSCNTYRTTHSGAGVLDTRAKELAGPYSTTNTTGYTPCVYTAPTTGTYWVAIYGTDGVSSSTNGTSVGSIDTPDITTNQGSGVAMWDITVRSGSATSGTNKPGRVFVDYLAQYTSNNGQAYQIYSTMYAATTDGYVYKVDTNGLDPNGFIFYGNRVGFYDPDGKTPLYHDVVYTENTLSSPVGGAILAPASAKIFFTNPLSSDLPVSILPTPVTPNISNITFVGSASGNNGYYTKGGVFSYTGNVGGITEIVIQGSGQTDFDPANQKNRRLLSESYIGSNQITWDGKDNSGTDFPVGTNYPFKVTFHAGEYHFPMIDSENSVYGGPIITMLNPIGGTCPFGNCKTGFYDDRDYKVSTGTIVPTTASASDVGVTTLPGDTNSLNPPTVNHSDMTTGYDTSTTQRAYGNSTGTKTVLNSGFGNWKALDLWAYFPVSPIQNTLNVVAEISRDLRIVKTHSGTFTIGGTGTFNLDVTNVGTSNIPNSTTTVSDTLPTGLTLTGNPTGTGWSCNGAAGLTSFTCTRTGTLAAAASYPTITYTVNVVSASSTTITNTATVANTNDGNSGNNSSSDSVTVIAPQLTISKTDSVSNAAALGSPFNWTIQVSNTGTASADFASGKTILSDPLPSGATYGTPVISNVTNVTNAAGIACSINGSNVLACTANGAAISFMASGSSMTVTVPVTPTAVATLTNTATVDPDNVVIEANESDNTSTDAVVVTGSDISVTKTASPSSAVLEGGTITYTVTAKNNGPRDATGIVVTDSLPSGLTYVSSTPSQGTYTSSTGLWAVGSLTNGNSATLTITAKANSGTGGTSITNTATRTASSPTDTLASNDSASATVSAVSIDAVDDAGASVNGTAGGTSLANVLVNDKLNGVTATLSNISLSQVSTTNAGVTLDAATGKVNVAAGTPSGSYTVNYQICDKLNPTFCDTANVTVPVVVIDAVNDSGALVNGAVGGQSLANVLVNDTLNGTLTSLSAVNLTQVSTTNAGVTLDIATGKVNVAAGTPAGSYSVTYQICDKLNPTFCDTAVVSVPVEVIDAVNDNGSSVNGFVGGQSLLNVLANDTLNGASVALSAVNLTQVNTTNAGVTLDTTSGKVNVAVGTPSGTYTVNYQICDKANPTFCDTAVVTVPVTAAVIDAVADTSSTVNGVTGATNAINVFTNDTLNGTAVDPAKVNLTVATADPTGHLTLNSDGSVSVAAGTPGGTYTLTYQICEKLNPTNCDTALVTVPVEVIDAVNDSGSLINGTTGGQSLANVLVNDTLNGVVTSLSAVNLTQVSTTNAGVTLDTATGKVNVAAGTPSGSYTVTYQICDKANPTFCDKATVSVPVEVIDAVNDTGSLINGVVGGQSLANVLVNDTLNGVATSLSAVNLTQVSTTNAGVTLDTATGKVNVAAGTPNGNYTVTYKICDKANSSFCDTAVVSVPVEVIDAVNDSGAVINGTAGGQSLADVLANDTLNGTAVALSAVNLTQVSTTNAGVTLDTATGKVNVAAGTPSGNYLVTYKICDKLNTTFCDSAVVTVPVVVIDAVNDSGNSVNGFVGGQSLANVLANDTLNGSLTTLSAVNLTQVSTTNAGVTLDATTGKVNVVAGAPSGNYTVHYRICDKANPTFCDEADVTVPVTVAVIDAVADSSAPINGVAGGTNVVNVFGNDTLNGSAVDPSKVTLSTTVADPTGHLTLNPDGSVDVAAGTPGGSYSLTYQICEKLNPTNCDTATVTVPVVVIDAVNDSGSVINGVAGGQSLANVLANDTLNGAPITLSAVNLTQVNTTNASVTLDQTTGKVNVAAGTPNGNYTLTYKICDKANPGFCDTADVTVPVMAIDAVNDSGAAVNGVVGGESLANVLTNDTLNGAAITLSDVNLTQVSTTNPGVTLDETTGKVNVAAGTPSGTYTLTYKICDKANPTYCDTADVTVPVVVIDAVNDTGVVINGVAGGQSLADVLANDTLNGAPVALADVKLTQVSTTDSGVTLDATTGKINVAAGTSSGSYTVTYQICDKANPTFCDTATVTVPVEVIDAVDDAGSAVNGYVGGESLADVLTNDTLNGASITLREVNLSQVSTTNPGVTLDVATGKVNVAAGTPSGSYSVTYQICDKSNPTFCDQANVSVPVTTAPIDAIDDSSSTINGASGATDLLNVLDNDTLNSAPVKAAEVTLSTTVADPTGHLTLNPDGSVDLAAGTPSGTYTLTYQICEKLNPTNCDTAIVTVPVAVIDAVNDNGASVNGYVGGESLADVLANDSLNGAAITLADVNLTQVSTTEAGVTLDETTGKVNVAAGTPSGSYTLTYKICDKANPTFCDQAEVTVPVSAAVIDAKDDIAATVNGADGGIGVVNVFSNDTLNGSPVDPSAVTLTETTPDPTGHLTLNPDGSVDVAAGTPGGTYTLTYQICEKLNPTNCDSATVTVPVVAIDALDDTGNSVNGYVGGESLANVLANDTLNGVLTNLAAVNLTQVSTTNPGVTLDETTGKVNVAAGTPSGSYTVKYQICDKANPTFCDQAEVTVPVTAAVIDAKDDTAATVNGTDGATAIVNVFGNDTLNGVAVVPSEVTLTEATPDPTGHLALNPDGSVDVAAGTPSGTYTLTYQICEILNPTNCDTAVVTVPVVVIDAVNDAGASVNGSIGGESLPDVLTNDTLNGAAVSLSDVNLTQVSTTNAGVTLDPTTGKVNVAAGTASGNYTLTYKICDKANPTFCDTADVTVPVSAATIDALNDTSPAINGTDGGTNVVNIFGNDTLNGTAVDPSKVTLSEMSPDPTGHLTLNPDGSVDVAAGTPGGTYTLTYQICENLNPTNCDTAIVTVPVTVIDAVNDSGTTINGFNGGQALADVLANDTLNGASITLSDVNLTQTGTTNPGVTLDETSGKVNVAAGTASGNYTVTYKICDKANPTFCDTAVVTVPVVTIDAVNDSGTVINGVVGGESLANVLVNDKLNGTAVALSDVNLTQVSTTNAGVSLDETTGKVNVAAGTAGGNYNVTYQICDKANPTFCDTAVVTVPVVVIDAVNDSGSVINGVVGGESLADVLTNDTLNGAPISLSDVNLTQLTTTNAGVTLDETTGKVNVVAGTPSGSYTVTYKICDKLNPTFCDTADVTVPVVVIDAVDDSGSVINGVVGGESLANVLVNDTLNGASISLSDLNLTQVSTTNPNVTLDETTGKVNVAAGTPSGSYLVRYQICDKANPTFCDTADVTVPVVVIDAVNDSGSVINGVVGGESLANVLANDTLNGASLTLSDVNLTQVSTTNPNVTLDETTGKVNVAAGTPSGSYQVRYQICDKANPSFCDTADVTVPVVVIDAVNDSGSVINGVVGGESLADVLTNDTLNGASITLADVNLTQVSTTNPKVTLDETTGKVNVAAGTPSGNYTLTYKICDKANPTFCDTADVTVPVVVIDAIDDDGAVINGVVGGESLADVLANDTLNGAAITLADVNLSQVSTTNANVTLDATTGKVNVAPGTASGTYTVHYRICDKANPTFCDEADVTVPVVVINAVDYSGTVVNGVVGGESLANVLANDTLNGASISLADVNLTQVSTTNANVTLDETTGKVNVAAGTPSGTYTVHYQICDKANPTFCDEADVTVPVVVINAIDDSGSVINGVVGGESLMNVLANDFLNGAPVTIDDVNLTMVSTTNANVTLDEVTGEVDVAAGTPGGTYTVHYKICDKANPTFCDEADVTVPVVVIDAVNDSGSTVNGYEGGESLADVLANDSLNGASVTLDDVNLTQVSTTIAGVTLNTSDGSVNVAPGTPSGTYTVTYQICDKLNPSFCDQADVSVPVSAAVIDAKNDTGATVNGTWGATNVLNVFDNDTLNGAAVNPSEVTLSETTPDPTGHLTLNSDGSVDVAAGTPGGTYTLTYQICENLNPTNCDTAVATVPVAVIDAVDDSGASVNGSIGGQSLANVLVNDTLNGAAVTLGEVNLTQVTTTNAGVTLDVATGKVNVAAGTPGGSYVVTYQICDKANPTFCDTADVTVPVSVAAIDAVNDSSATINGTPGATNVLNVFDNDTLNAVAVDPSEVTLSETLADPTGHLTLNPDGSVDVAAGTPSGTYTLTYQICENLNPANCDTAVVTVPVAVIDAVDDSGASVDGYVGGQSLADVLANDTLNGASVTLDDVNLTQVTTTNPGVTLNLTDGSVNVAAGTPGGSYTLTYKICDKANPTFCDTAEVTVPVSATPIDAVDDSADAVNGTSGAANVLNVFDNDTLNSAAVKASEVNLSVVTADPTGHLTLNPNGSVDVDAGTPSGTYTLTYQICEKLNPSNCDTAVVTVPVVVIDAVNDSGSTINGKVGGTSLANVLTNDTLNGITPTVASVTLTQVSSTSTNVSLNPGTGAVEVAAGTASGNYSLTYKICDASHPAICDTAVVTVPVVASNIDAEDDNYTGTPIEGKTGGHAGNALTNDTLNGAAVDTADITISVLTAADDPGVTLDTTTGSVDVAPGTSGGTHSIVYQICEKLNPSNCDSATITVLVNTYDLSLTMTLKTGQPDVVKAGDTVTYTITVTNQGNLPSGTPIVVTDTIPTGMSLEDTNWVAGTGNTATYTLPSSLLTAMAAPHVHALLKFSPSSGSSISFDITLRVANDYAGGKLTNFAEISTDQGDDIDSTPGNGPQTPAEDDEASVDVTAHNYSITIKKTADVPSFALVGDLVHYTYVVTNVGDVDQTNVVLTDDKIDDDATNIDCNGTGSNVIAVLKPGDANAATCVATYTITAADVTNKMVTNTASVVSDQQTDPITTKLTVPGILDPVVGIKVFDSKNLPLMQWTMTWINSSNALPLDGRVRDPLPLGTTFVPGTGPDSGYAVPAGAPAGSTNVGVSCTTPAGSTTITHLCYYRGPEATTPTGQIIWEGVLGADKGHVTSDTAKNPISISYTVKIPDDAKVETNIAVFDSDLNSDGDYDDPGESQSATAMSTWSKTVTPSAASTPAAELPLPVTGFAPNTLTHVPAQPAVAMYQSLSSEGMSLDIPALKLSGLEIVGVPQTANGWDIQWLDNKLGYLDGSAFPTWKGNSVLTGHVYLSNGLPGPFVNLTSLKYGDKIIVHAWNQDYVYEVRETMTIGPNDSADVLKHEDDAWITLLTCKGYDEKSKSYTNRYLVRAVLVSIK